MSLVASVGLTVVLGRNGVGKTTLLESFANLPTAVFNKVSISGCTVTNRNDRRRAMARIGFVPQEDQLLGSFTVAEFLRYAGWLKGMSGRRLLAAVETAMRRFALDDHSDATIRTLSGGLRQRAGLAASVIHDPEIWILDEPTVGLDPEQRAYFRDVVMRASGERCVILSTHVLADVEGLEANYLILGNGSALFAGSLQQLLVRDDHSCPGATALERAYLAVVDEDARSKRNSE